jgi:hypothetical protein
LEETLRRARIAATPLVAIESPDQWQTVHTIAASEALGNGETVKLLWDCVGGLRPISESARKWVNEMGSQSAVTEGTSDPAAMLEMIKATPKGAMILMMNAQHFLDEPIIAQAVSNLRDPFKAQTRMLVLLSPTLKLPGELLHDVVTIPEPLPDDGALGEIVRRMHSAAKAPDPDEQALDRIVASVRGLSAFEAEQVVAMAITREGVNLAQSWELKRQKINAVSGLEMRAHGPTFDDIRGNAGIVRFARLTFDGKVPPRVIIWLDEIEKALAGATGPVGDTSGTSGDALGTLLRWMQDSDVRGMICVGPPGSGKSLFAQAMGATYDVPTVAMDLGGMKDALVGNSEKNIREAVRTIDGIAAGRAYVVATSNGIESLPTELKRRFRAGGTWFFDLPTAEERDAIWQLYLTKHGMKTSQKRPPDGGWTGAEIANAVEMAWSLGMPLVEAARYVIPVYRSSRQLIDKLRASADGAYLSASSGEVYARPAAGATSGRDLGGV